MTIVFIAIGLFAICEICLGWAVSSTENIDDMPASRLGGFVGEAD